jgi:hypothetical protein
MAINPLPFLQAMPDPGQAFMDSFQKARAARVAEDQAMQQQVAQEQQKMQFQQWSQLLLKDPSPQNVAQGLLKFPQMAEVIKQAYEPMNEQRKAQEVAFYGKTLSALNRGDKDYAKQLVNERLTATRNTPGQEQTVKLLEEGLAQFDSNPEALKAGLALTIQQLDPKAYETVYANQDMKLDTALIKNLVAEMGPEAVGTPEFKQALKDERTKVTITDPRIGFFSGPAEEFRRRFGGEPPANAQRGGPAKPKSKAEFDALPPGTTFYDPNGVIRTKPGGGSGNATSGFRP